MTPEQLQAAYFKGHGPVYPDGDFMGRLAEAHLAGLAEVARQQAEHDAGIAETVEAESLHDARVGNRIADAIRDQFEKEGN